MIQQALRSLTSVISDNLELVRAWGPVVVGLGAIVTSFFASLSLLKTQRAQFNLAKSKEERDEIVKKLNSFYGPFKQLRTQSRILYAKFATERMRDYNKKNPNKPFRTLRFLLQGKEELDASDSEILTQILQLGQRQLRLIQSYSGVVDKPELQELLGKLGAHIRILRLASQKKLTRSPEQFEDIVFPLEIDGAIESAILRLQDRLTELSQFQTNRLPRKPGALTSGPLSITTRMSSRMPILACQEKCLRTSVSSTMTLRRICRGGLVSWMRVAEWGGM